MPVHPRHKLRKLGALGETIHLLKKTAEKTLQMEVQKGLLVVKTCTFS